MASDDTGMTVHDIRDGQRFVSSGIAVCTTGERAVTVTAVTPSGDHEGLEVTAYDTFVALPADQSIPISVRGSLGEVTARSGDRRVEGACGDRSDTTELTYIAWEVSGAGPGPGRAQRFTLSYEDDRGRTGQVDIPVAITLCDHAEKTGPCAG